MSCLAGTGLHRICASLLLPDMPAGPEASACTTARNLSFWSNYVKWPVPCLKSQPHTCLFNLDMFVKGSKVVRFLPAGKLQQKPRDQEQLLRKLAVQLRRLLRPDLAPVQASRQVPGSFQPG